MNEKHLTDFEVENYVYDDKIHENRFHDEHLKSCLICKEKLEAVQNLKHSLSNQPLPGFSFDVVSLIMPQIDALSTEKNWIGIIVNSLVALSIISTACLIIYFRNYFSDLAFSLTANWISLALIPIIFYMAWSCKDLIQTYRNSLNQLKTS
jgi:hypothetical protein